MGTGGLARILSGIGLFAASMILASVNTSELLPAAIVIIIEWAALGLVPFLVGFFAQMLLRSRALHDGLLALGACALVLAWWLVGGGASAAGAATDTVYLILAAAGLTWFTSLGAAAARAIGRSRRVAPGPVSEV